MPYFLFSFIYLFIFTFSCSATIIHAPTLNTIEPYIDQLDKNSLVVLDVDYTILVFNDCALSEKYRKHFMAKLNNLKNCDDLMSNILL